MLLLSALATLSTAQAAGDGVLYYTGHSGFSVSSYFPASELEDVIVNEECGSFTETSTWPSDLSVYRMVVLMIPSNSWSTTETQQIQDFIDDGGVLVAVGDSSGYDSAHVSPMNTLLGDLGVASSLQTAAIDSGCSGNQAPAATTHALTEGISSTGIQFGWSSDINVDSTATELFTGPSGQALAAVEGQVVLISDINVFIDDCNLNSDNRQLFANLYHYGTSTDSCDMDGDGYDAEHCGGSDCDDCDSGADIGSTWYADDDGDSYGDASSTTEACTQPSGYVADDADCDDTDSAISPAATEVCDGEDNDCDGDVDETGGTDTYYADFDGDGYGDPAYPVSACSEPSGYVANDEDCDDTDAAIHPAAAEVCDGEDNDCDGDTDEDDAADTLTWYADSDGDSYGDASSTTEACEEPSGYVSDDADCDDTDAAIHPSAAEVCDGDDNDCDGDTDEDDAADAATWYADADGDAYGDASSTTGACVQPAGYVSDSTDCDDTDAAINPAAAEVCDGEDNDCDGDTDEDDAADALTWYADSDGDSYGDVSSTTESCAQPTGFVSDSTDCDDTDAAINPAATEVCDGDDNDCDGDTDEDDAADAATWYADADGDSYGDSSTTDASCAQPTGYVSDSADCDDTDAAIHPAATEVCDGDDNDCDGDTDEDDAADSLTWYADADGDAYGDASSTTESCVQPSGYVSDDADCDDTDAAIHPSAAEVCDGSDNDCDGDTDEDDAADAATWYADSDGDSYGDSATTDASCAQPTGFVSDDADCDDTDSAINPAATEVCDGDDNDCDGDTDEDAADALTWYADADGDSYGDSAATDKACAQPAGFISDSTDCDDTDAAINPAAAEVCDGDDNDCDGDTDEDDAADALTWYADSDGDSYGDVSTTDASCAQPTGYVSDSADCDDTDAAIHPAATEVCDGDDNDCDGDTDEDDAADALTWYADADGDSYGDAGTTDASCAQPTGFVSDSADCDDTDAAINPAAAEVCDGSDNDCDGDTDEDDAADALTWYADADGDAYGDASSTTGACAQPTGYVSDDADCDDTDAAINPAAAEVCDGSDNDCDGTIDNDDAADATTWYADTDGDSYGDAASPSTSCEAPAGTVEDATDCDDTDAAISPAAAEVCDGSDNDCDGDTDEEAADAATWYTDSDGDGFGDAASTTEECEAPSGFVSDDADCDDTDAAINPAAAEVCDGSDNDCDGDTDEDDAADVTSWYTDADGDGYGDPATESTSCEAPSGTVEDATDCDDTDAAISPAAAEVPYDGIDDDCDGDDLTDYDGDGFDGTAVSGDDCDDTDASISPDAVESANGIDDDCDGSVDEDTDYEDGDGDGYAPAGGDCDDDDASINPGTAESADGIDNDCDGTVDEGTEAYDDDGDGYTELDGDCDDSDSAINPDAADTSNGIDDDCDGVVDTGSYDEDGDGWLPESGDCDGTDGTVYPGASEVADGIDNDCDGTIDEGTEACDDDGDGYTELEGDCDDSDSATAPDAAEVLDGMDNNCDGRVDEGTEVYDDDGDGWTEWAGDCDDADSAINPGELESADGIDNDCDGEVDEGTDAYDDDGDGYAAAEGDCDDLDGFTYPGAEEICDGMDNDCDGEIDNGCGEALDTGGLTEADPKGCSTVSGGSVSGLWLLALAGALWRRRRAASLAMTGAALVGCGNSFESNLELRARHLESEPVVDLGAVSDADTHSIEVILEATGEGRVTLSTIDLLSDPEGAFDIDGWPEVIEAGESAAVTVWYTPPETGWHRARLTVHSDAYEDLLPVELRANAVEASARVWPERIDFGPVAVGEVAEELITLHNTSDITLSLDDWAADAPFSLEGSDLELRPDEERQLTAQFAPEDDAAAEAALSLSLSGLGLEVALLGNACGLGEPSLYDADGDGVTTCGGDCDDGDPDVLPGAAEVMDEADNDCDGDIDEGTILFDDDGDGYSESEGDCVDSDDAIHPGAEEVANGIDDDCDGTVDAGSYDGDGDGYTTGGGDCDDAEPLASPGTAEIADGIDNDCDGTIDEGTEACDDDGDGYTELDGDCDDSDSATSPDAAEVADWQDNDCDGEVDEGTDAYDDDGDGYTEDGGDCDDADSSVSPAQLESLGDGIDNDCDGSAE